MRCVLCVLRSRQTHALLFRIFLTPCVFYSENKLFSGMWSFFSRDPSKDFAFEIGEPVPGLEDKSLWTLHKARKKGSGEEVSVFVYDVKQGNDTQLEMCKAAVKRLKTLRHPSILTYIESLETDRALYLATEFVEPLGNHIGSISKEGHQKDLYMSWGIFQITRALSFLINDGNLRHNNVCLASVFVNAAGEWKLGGVEYVAGVNENALPIKLIPVLDKYDPPEKSDPSKQHLVTKCSTDMWGLGCLIWEVFNGPLPKPMSLKSLENIPKSLCAVYCELVGANPSTRPNPADVITRCRKNAGYFKNELVDALLFLEEIQIKEKGDKNRFFTGLVTSLDNFPEHICRHKILPQLITAFEFGEAGSAVLAPMFKLGRLLNEAEYQKKIVPCVVKLFASNDRATRIRLLQQLEHFINHLHSNTVNDQIFPQVVHGFMDTNPTIREQTVKSIIHLAPKLNYNNLNVEVLRHFARLQAKDDQGGIRTNTTVCLGKIAQHLHPQIRQKVLISAFVRAMRDPFPPARSAGVLAMAATQQYFLLSEVAARILPALCQLTTDPEKNVRDSVFRTIKGFLGKLEKVSEDPSLRETIEADVHAATPSLSNAAATWAGWAVTAVTAKFYRSQSDTVKSHSPMNSKTLSKPGSLEQPSSSSISTTTSSVTSMTSLEQEESKGGDSISDYDENWDTENWGDMETQGSSSHVTEAKVTQAKEKNESKHDGWDNEEWGALEDVEESAGEKPSSNEGWENSLETNAKTNVTGWSDTNGPTEFSHLSVRGTHPQKSATGTQDTEWEPFDDVNSSAAKLEEVRKRREEKKLQRQKELESRRASRNAGPMKLGAKKI